MKKIITLLSLIFLFGCYTIQKDGNKSYINIKGIKTPLLIDEKVEKEKLIGYYVNKKGKKKYISIIKCFNCDRIKEPYTKKNKDLY